MDTDCLQYDLLNTPMNGLSSIHLLNLYSLNEHCHIFWVSFISEHVKWSLELSQTFRLHCSKFIEDLIIDHLNHKIKMEMEMHKFNCASKIQWKKV